MRYAWKVSWIVVSPSGFFEPQLFEASVSSLHRLDALLGFLKTLPGVRELEVE